MRVLCLPFLAACALVGDGAPGEPLLPDVDQGARVLADVGVVGSLGYGETSPPTPYRAPPLYSALTFTGAAGDPVAVQARSDRAGVYLVVTDAALKVLASAHVTTGDASVSLTLPADGSYDIAFRDGARHAATFTIHLDGAHPCIPMGCAVAGARCGDLPDGCGGTVACACSPPATCGGAGIVGSCGAPDDPLTGLFDAALVAALRDGMAGATSLGYDRARHAMFVADGGLDVVDGLVTCIYTGRQVAPDDSPTPPGMSIEHAWPQSLGAAGEPMKSDLHHLFAADGRANSARNNNLYGETDCGGDGHAACLWATGAARLGPSATGATVFEPRPESRGDVARATFYFAVRYAMPVAPDEEAVLRAWNEADPPDDAERLRNDRIEALQHDRNPFVDRPDLVRHVGDF